jgi:hypothetical protein
VSCEDEIEKEDMIPRRCASVLAAVAIRDSSFYINPGQVLHRVNTQIESPHGIPYLGKKSGRLSKTSGRI